MKKIILLLLIAFTINSCCKKVENCEPNCPLTDGTKCGTDFINVNDSCVCKDGYEQFWYQCFNPAELQNNQYFVELDCLCYDNILFQISKSSIDFTLRKKDGREILGGPYYIGTETNFVANIDLDCDYSDDEKIFVDFVVNIIGDSLYLDLLFRVQGPNWEVPVDTCSYVIPKNV